MVLVMDVGNELVTHRVVSVNADGTFATRGDANTVNDAWAGMDIKVEGLYVATIPWLGNVLPVRAASAASFVDQTTASMSITVGPWPPTPVPPTPPECAGMTFSQVIVGTPGDDVIDAGNGGALVFGLGRQRHHHRRQRQGLPRRRRRQRHDLRRQRQGRAARGRR